MNDKDVSKWLRVIHCLIKKFNFFTKIDFFTPVDTRLSYKILELAEFQAIASA